MCQLNKIPISVCELHARDEFAWRQLWAAYLDFYGAAISAEVTEHTWECILDPDGPIFGRIAMVGDLAAGFAICVVHEATWSIRPTCYLEDLFVDPAARGAGVGRALLSDLVAIGQARGWGSVYWHTRADNARARQLYDQYVSADDFVRYRLSIQPWTNEPL